MYRILYRFLYRILYRLYRILNRQDAQDPVPDPCFCILYRLYRILPILYWQDAILHWQNGRHPTNPYILYWQDVYIFLHVQAEWTTSFQSCIGRMPSCVGKMDDILPILTFCIGRMHAFSTLH